MSHTLNSGTKIFDIIEILLDNPLSREEFSIKLKNRGFISNAKTITKYLRTLRSIGFEIKREKNGNYEILKAPFNINIENEKEGFIVFENILNSLFENSKKKNFHFKYKVNNLIEYQKNDITLEKKHYKILKRAISKCIVLNKHILNKENIEFFYKKEKIRALPKKIKFSSNGFFLYAYLESAQKTKIFKISCISKIRAYKGISFEIEPCNKTTFQIKGSLIKNYVLKEGEIAHYKKNYILVTNFYEEKEELFSKLAKYGSLCKVVSPKKDKEYFIKKIKETLEYYKSL